MNEVCRFSFLLRILLYTSQCTPTVDEPVRINLLLIVESEPFTQSIRVINNRSAKILKNHSIVSAPSREIRKWESKKSTQ